MSFHCLVLEEVNRGRNHNSPLKWKKVKAELSGDDKIIVPECNESVWNLIVECQLRPKGAIRIYQSPFTGNGTYTTIMWRLVRLPVALSYSDGSDPNAEEIFGVVFTGNLGASMEQAASAIVYDGTPHNSIRFVYGWNDKVISFARKAGAGNVSSVRKNGGHAKKQTTKPAVASSSHISKKSRDDNASSVGGIKEDCVSSSKTEGDDETWDDVTEDCGSDVNMEDDDDVNVDAVAADMDKDDYVDDVDVIGIDDIDYDLTSEDCEY